MGIFVLMSVRISSMILYSKRICFFYQDEVPPERFPVLRSLSEEIQFNNFTVPDTLKANGELSLGENIADLGGLNVAYSALQKVLTGKEII
ncbi:MAG: M13-type metalloendopeptidase [Bacteroidota bacterium]|nr:M13-type metalloendopeptidase [Bacteroidota bacterium]